MFIISLIILAFSLAENLRNCFSEEAIFWAIGLCDTYLHVCITQCVKDIQT